MASRSPRGCRGVKVVFAPQNLNSSIDVISAERNTTLAAPIDYSRIMSSTVMPPGIMGITCSW